jgi:hypothetical protein
MTWKLEQRPAHIKITAKGVNKCTGNGEETILLGSVVKEPLWL